ncbi:leucine-rich repeat domain-containing protein [Oribacterium sinus]|uniref:leucine-rich repeat domain-containing protein n=1 Tax=Oribacterium sinus TaxID=237576 RepID=UPI0028D335D7|nr:leucine-rich repeat domain-containing protein [Oribacterium sinus]
MTLTKMECPNCHGTLEIPEGMKEGFVTCEYCKTKVYIEPTKPNITQNIHIDNVNMGQQRSAPPARQELSAVQTIVLMGTILSAIFILFVSNTFRAPHKSVTLTTAKFRTVPEDETVKSFVESAFGKSLKDITREDYNSLAFLSIHKVSNAGSDQTEKWRFDYAKSMNEDGTAKDPETLYFPITDTIDEADMQIFTGLIKLSLGYQVHFDYSANADANTLKSLTNLRYYSGENEDFQTISKLFANPEQILGLYNIMLDDDTTGDSYSDENTEGKDPDAAFKAFSSLEELTVHVDDDYSKGLLFLRNFPNLKTLALGLYGDTPTDLSPLSSLSSLSNLDLLGTKDSTVENLGVLSGMPQLEQLSLRNLKDVKDLNFVQNMPKLKSLNLEDLAILNLDGLSGHLSLNSLSIACSSLENVNALSTLSSLQTLSISYHTYDVPDLHGLSALENVKCYSMDRDSISHMPSIKNLTIDNYGSEYSADFLQGMNALTNLTIIGNGIIDEVEPDLGSVLRALPSLSRLEFQDSPFSRYKDYTETFTNTGVKELLFTPNKKQAASSDPVLPVSLSRMADDNTVESLTLTQAILRNIDYESEDFSANIKPFLSHYKALKSLDISSNKLQSLDCLDGLTSLEEVDFSNNYISDISVLRNLPNLKKVKMSGNPIVNAELLPDSVEVVK